MSDSIAKGSPLTQETWHDFVTRLHHDCVGAGVDRHFTRDALFVVEEKVYDYGIDTDYGGDRRESKMSFWIGILEEFGANFVVIPHGLTTQNGRAEFVFDEALRVSNKKLDPFINFQRD